MGAPALKTYKFDEAHNETKPSQWWFQHTEHGLALFVVFYTRACRWGQCTGCNLPSLMTQRHIGFRAIMRQVDALFAIPEVRARFPGIHQLFVSNNGSVLDEETFSSTALIYLVSQANVYLPNLAVLTLETRPEYVDIPELEFLARSLKEGEMPTDLELAVGFEAFDDRIRNKAFRKGLSLRSFEECAGKAARHGFRLRCYFMQKPVVGMTDAEAIADIRNGIDYLADVATRHNLRVNMHLNPTYVARGTPLAEAFARGEYAPPRLADVATAVRYAQGKRVAITVGLNDEGLAVEGGSFLRPEEEHLRLALDRFNETQDFAVLAS